jgi:dipeptidyl aminopeptidase/acylaminoacyl peptidase
MDVLWERSPLEHVAKVKAATMRVHGENDNDVTKITSDRSEGRPA